LTTGSALAADKLELQQKEVQESSGSWLIKVRIELPKPPSMVSISVNVTFAKVMTYERAILQKGKAPVLNKLRVDPAQTQCFPMIVHFADTSGKVFKATTYEFDVKRAAGFFEAGEYLIKIAGPDGEIGVAQRLVLNGDNEPVYRGPIEFVEQVGDAGAPAKKDDGPSTGPENPDVAPIGSATSLIPTTAYDKTPEEELKSRPKGCGCDIAASPFSTNVAWTLVGLGALVATSRRRTRS
jgi:MYXO-CTERM domain-containing protein